jgi:hypothetical protein
MDDDLDKARSKLTVLSITQDCRLALQQCTQNQLAIESRWAQNRLSDFNLWDAGVGASAKKHHSLDVRLRDDAGARKFVTSSLSTLKTWLYIYRRLTVEPQEASEDPHNDLHGMHSDEDDDISLPEAKNSIGQLLDVLVKLGIAIRQAGAASRLSNADGTFMKHGSDYVELEGELADSFRFKGLRRRVTKEISSQELLEKESGWDHENLFKEERDILIRTNVRRRHRFLYARRRAEKLRTANALIRKEPDDIQSNLNTAPSPASNRDQSIPRGALPRAVPATHTGSAAGKRSTTRSERSVGSTNKLSIHKPAVPLPSAIEDDRPLAPPTVTTSKVSYPKGPKLEEGASVAVCPYCRQTIPRATARGSAWM